MNTHHGQKENLGFFWEIALFVKTFPTSPLYQTSWFIETSLPSAVGSVDYRQHRAPDLEGVLRRAQEPSPLTPSP